MEKRKQYKPILIFYIEGLADLDSESKMSLMKQIAGMKEELGYDIIVLPGRENKAEIISAYKATKVEDIQKYIDLKFIENGKP